MKKKKLKYIFKMILKTSLLMLPFLWVIFSHNFEAFNDFKSWLLDFNPWYDELLHTLSGSYVGSIETPLLSCLLLYPLYIIWFEVFDLLVHLFLSITDLFHKFMGEND